jgi:hypothetical protein
MIIRIGRSTSLIESRSSSVGFPSMGGNTSNASLKRRVTASGRMTPSMIHLKARRGQYSIATMMMVAMVLAIARLGDSVAKETRESACAVAMATAVLVDFSVSSSSLISMPGAVGVR